MAVRAGSHAALKSVSHVARAFCSESCRAGRHRTERPSALPSLSEVMGCAKTSEESSRATDAGLQSNSSSRRGIHSTYPPYPTSTTPFNSLHTTCLPSSTTFSAARLARTTYVDTRALPLSAERLAGASKKLLLSLPWTYKTKTMMLMYYAPIARPRYPYHPLRWYRLRHLWPQEGCRCHPSHQRFQQGGGELCPVCEHISAINEIREPK